MKETRPDRGGERVEDRKAPSPKPAPSVPWASILLVVVASTAAGAVGHMVAGPNGWAGVAVVALFGGACVLAFGNGRTDGGDARALRLAQVIDGEADAASTADWSGSWGALAGRVSELSAERRTWSTAILEHERTRRQLEAAIATLREGKDPLTEIPELRVGPLHDLLEAAQERASTIPVVSRIPIDEAELIGDGGERLPEDWPAGQEPGATGSTLGAAASPAVTHGAELPTEAPRGTSIRIDGDSLRDLDELIEGLERLRGAFDDSGVPTNGGAPARTPAQLVDAVVHTAADGIEDLAAGLMRANELASVAERVTNRATLLALNAALEATRSGSEAFAAIAEETRRLAEFAREATDTISRLASEIEYKVTETITAIHATSEDAKSAVASLSSVPASSGPSLAARREVVVRLLEKARSIRRGQGSAKEAIED